MTPNPLLQAFINFTNHIGEKYGVTPETKVHLDALDVQVKAVIADAGTKIGRAHV